MPTRPQLASAAAAETKFQTWDEIMAEATDGIEDYQLPVSPDEVLTIPCPSGDQMQAFGEASRNMDDTAAAVAIFGDNAPRILELTAKQPFFVRAKILAKVMQHYGMQAGLQTPE
jgi:hypothetical protein